MSDSNADACIRLQEQMESTRSNFEYQWREVAERVRPASNQFRIAVAEGQKRDQLVFDDTAPLALTKFTAAVISMCFNQQGQWHKLSTADPRLADMPEVKRYFEQLTDILFKARYSPMANFQSQLAEMVIDVGCFGNGVLFTDDVLGMGLRYKSIPLAESWVAENGHGIIDTHHRKFQLTAKAAVSLFDPSRLPPAIVDCAEKQPLTKFWFLHCVGPNEERQTRMRDYRGMQFKSCYIAQETRTTVSEGGYRTFPFAIPRFETAPNETYGRGPAMKVLRSIKALNEMKKTIIRAGQLVVAPPIMLSDDASLAPFSMRSNALNYGYVDNQGRPMAQAFNSQGQVDIGVELMDKEREAINDAFFVTLFRILVEEPQITATEAMLRAQEKGQLLQPTMGRMQSDVGGPMVSRELDILFEMDRARKALGAPGLLPEPPQVLLEAGAEYKVEYQSPLNQAQKAGAGVGILNTINALAPLATAMGPQGAATIMRILDPERTARALADANGAPERVLRTPEELAALDEQDQQAQQAQMLLQAAPVAAGAAKDLAQAGALAAAGPPGQAPQIFGQPAQ
jgi:hypothetical protein